MVLYVFKHKILSIQNIFLIIKFQMYDSLLKPFGRQINTITLTHIQTIVFYMNPRLIYAWGRILIHPDDVSIWSSWYYFYFSTQIDLFFFRGHHHNFYSNADKQCNLFSAALGESAGIIFGCLCTQMNSDLKGWLTNSSKILLLLACCWNVCDSYTGPRL